MEYLTSLFDTSDFPARWHCGHWTSLHGWMHIVSDLAVWSAYFTIPGVLLFFTWRRKDLPFRKVFVLFGAFILFCGTTHLMEAIIFWWPAYRLAGLIKFLTAAVSWATVVVLIGAVPKVLAMRSPEELEREISARKLAEEALQLANVELEQRVQERTSEIAEANRALRFEREWFSTTVASIGDAVIATDTGGRVMLLNPVAQALTGWTQQEALSRPLTDVFQIVNEDTRQPVANPALQALEHGMIVGLANHTVLIAKDGTCRPIDDSAAPIREQNGTVMGAVLVFRDVSERRALEKQNQERLTAARFLASIVESSADAIISRSQAGIIQTWNAGAERLFGYTAEQAIGSPITLIVPSERADEEDEIVNSLRSGEQVDHFETVRIRSDQQPVHVSLTISLIRDEAGNVIGISKTARDITERKQSEQRIDNLLSQLKEADRRKDEFLATLAHEIRNPLAPIRTGLDVIKLAKNDPTTVDEIRGVMERQMQQLVSLVDDLLEVSRITLGKLQLKKSRVSLAEIVKSSVETSRPFVAEANHELIVNIPETPIVLEADPHRLAQVTSNLIINAAKFTPSGGKIWLSVESRPDQIVMTVKDNGLGIPRDKLDQVFEMFAQIDRTGDRNQPGLGIGLTLVKSLVELHGGKVDAQSSGVNQGSEFIVHLPVLAVEPTEHGNSDAVADQTTNGAPRRILVVDDNTGAAEVLSMLIRMLGNVVRVANDGVQAVEVAAEFAPELIFMDLGMPRMDGYETARHIRQQPWGKSIKLVALTGWGQEDDKRRTTEAGFDGHLVKPVELAMLKKFVDQLK